MALYDVPQAVVDWDESLKAVTLRWKGFAYGEALQTILLKVVEILAEKKSSIFLSDARSMRILNQDDQDWIAKVWLPKAMAAGLKWEAVVMPGSQFARNSVDQTVSKARVVKPQNLPFNIDYFETVEEAKDWLKDKN